jgi:hypothetical protein
MLNSYVIRRPIFWVIALLAGVNILYSADRFLWTGASSHPVKFGIDAVIILGILSSYGVAVRELQTARGTTADTVLKQIEDAVGLCCMFGFFLAMSGR